MLWGHAARGMGCLGVHVLPVGSTDNWSSLPRKRLPVVLEPRGRHLVLIHLERGHLLVDEVVRPLVVGAVAQVALHLAPDVVRPVPAKEKT